MRCGLTYLCFQYLSKYIQHQSICLPLDILPAPDILRNFFLWWLDATEGLHGGLGGRLAVAPPAPPPIPVESREHCLVDSVEGWRGDKSRLLQ